MARVFGGVHLDRINPSKTIEASSKLTTQKAARDIATKVFEGLAEVSIQIIPVEVREVFYNEEDIDNDNSLSYKDIGCLRFRAFKGFEFPNDLAYPLYSNIKNYPVFGEMVHVIIVGKVAYWMTPINQKRDVNNNSSIGMTGAFPLKQGKDTIYNLTKGFQPTTKARPTRQVAGDIVFEGRTGQSIKLGMNKPYMVGKALVSQPIIKLRLSNANEDVDARYKPKEENISDDAASIYLTYDEEISLAPARLIYNDDNKMTPTVHTGKQIILDSDSIVFNTKLGKAHDIKMYSGADVSIVSKGDTKIVGKNVYIGDARKKATSIDSPKGGFAERAVLGAALVDLLFNMAITLEAAGFDLQAGTSIGNLGMPAPDPQAKMAGSRMAALFGPNGSFTKENLRDALLSNHVYISRNSPGE